ncbi:uncharacterized protein [Dendropsophus ebraccatus]|uniref:uncharacterized protein n=1 Tax=Dendropsophus ebraccatus TaxID=150705 RepID=UPI00383125F1
MTSDAVRSTSGTAQFKSSARAGRIVSLLVMDPSTSDKTATAVTETKESNPKKDKPRAPERRCVNCNAKLSSSCKKNICPSCIGEIIKEDRSSFLEDIRKMMKEEIATSITRLPPPPLPLPPPTPPPAPLDLDPPQVSPVHQVVSNDAPVDTMSSYSASVAASEETTLSRKRRRHSSASSDESGQIQESIEMSDNETEQKEEIRKYFFPSEHTSALLKAVRDALSVEQVQEQVAPKDKMFQGLRAKKKLVFPVHDTLQQLITDEWAEPEKRLQVPSEIRRRLPFGEEDTSKWEDIPKIDAQVAKTTKKSLLPFENSSQLKDPMDRKAESLLKKSWETVSYSLKNNVAATCVARALHVWVEQLEGHLNDKCPRQQIVDSLPLLKDATAFLADATAESIRFAAKDGALTNAARRALWLKNWTGDNTAKSNLCGIPFEGQYVFGTHLDKIIEKSADKKKALPEEKPPQKKQQGKTEGLFRWVDIYYQQQLGNKYHQGGLPNRANSPSPTQIYNLTSVFRSPTKRISEKREEITQYGSNLPSSTKGERSGSLLELVSSKKTKRLLPSNYKPKTIEPICQISEVQDGINTDDNTPSSVQGIDGLHRSPGRLLSCPNTPGFPKISKVCDSHRERGSSLSVQSSPVRDLLGSKNLHQRDVRGDIFSPSPGNKYRGLPGRSPHHSRHTKQADTRSGDNSQPSNISRVDHQRRQIRPGAISQESVSRNPPRFNPSDVISSGGKNTKDPHKNQETKEQLTDVCERGNVSSRLNDFIHPSGALESSPFPFTSGPDSKDLEQKTFGIRQKVFPHPPDEKITSLVARKRESTKRGTVEPSTQGNSKNRRKPDRLGSPSRDPILSGDLGHKRFKRLLKPQRTQGSQEFVTGGSKHLKRHPCACSIGQCHHGSSLKTPGQCKTQSPMVSFKTNIHVGRVSSSVSLSNPPERNRKYSGRLSQSPPGSSRGVVSQRSDLPSASRTLGETRDRFVCHKKKQEGDKLLLTEPIRPSYCSRCPDTKLEGKNSLRLSSHPTDTKGTPEDQGSGNKGYSDSSILAEKELVWPPQDTSSGGASPTSTSNRPSLSGSDSPSRTRETTVVCMDPEETILRSRGLSEEVISTLMKSRKKFQGKNKGKKVSKSTIARWIKDSITEAYKAQDLPSPINIRAHSTRAMSTSWAERASASLEQICRAATWSSPHTFSRHYRLLLQSREDLSFGRKVLQAVVPP